MFSMLAKRSVQRLQNIYNIATVNSVISFRNCSTDKTGENKPNKENEKSSDDILGSIASKYKIFRNEDASVILDVNEENFSELQTEERVELEYDQYGGLNLERGLAGVFEIEDLVEALKRENAQDVFVAALPKDLKYVDYICVVTGRSYRHMLAIAQFIRKLFKIKRDSKDILPKIEGENSREWIALDLGNIALHIFSKEARMKYDLDSLWSLGEEFDDECNKPDDPIVQLLEKHSIRLKDLEPADFNN